MYTYAYQELAPASSDSSSTSFYNNNSLFTYNKLCTHSSVMGETINGLFTPNNFILWLLLKYTFQLHIIVLQIYIISAHGFWEWFMILTLFAWLT